MRSIRTVPVLATMLLLLPLATVAQTSPCTLGPDDAPAIGGLRIGMAPAEVAKIFPGGPGPVVIPARTLRRTPGFRGVRFLTLGFLDGRLAQIEARHGRVHGEDAQRFTKRLSESMKLPPDAWEHPAGGASRMECAGFTVYAVAERGAVTLASAAAVGSAARKLKDDQERKGKAFKP